MCGNWLPLKLFRSIFHFLLIAVLSTILAISLLLSIPPRISKETWRKLWNKFEILPERHKVDDASLLQSSHYIPQCRCFRNYFYSLTGDQRVIQSRLASTCSDPGTFYEPNQKVISLSMYIQNKTKFNWMYKMYQKGLEANLILMRKYYPGYSMRLYTDVNLTDDYCKILCANPDLFWCDIRHSPSLGNQQILYFRMWRFVLLGDESVDHFLSRDMDTYITARESDAVKDWLQHNTDKAIHVMRDYKNAHNLAILAGMWGASNTRLGLIEARRLRRSIFRQLLPNQSYPTFFDQVTLTSHIFYPSRKNVLAHDSYHCTKWKNWTRVRPFPRQRRNDDDLVGNYIYVKLKVSKCPRACRPVYGRDWEFC